MIIFATFSKLKAYTFSSHDRTFRFKYIQTVKPPPLFLIPANPRPRTRDPDTHQGGAGGRPQHLLPLAEDFRHRHRHRRPPPDGGRDRCHPHPDLPPPQKEGGLHHRVFHLLESLHQHRLQPLILGRSRRELCGRLNRSQERK